MITARRLRAHSRRMAKMERRRQECHVIDCAILIGSADSTTRDKRRYMRRLLNYWLGYPGNRKGKLTRL